MNDFVWSPVGTAARLKDLEAERDDACRLVAQMHYAATGYMQGPIRGVVEDIADLKTERDQLHAEIERLRADAERYRWLRDNEHIRRLDDAYWRYRTYSADICDAEIDAAIKKDQR